MTRLRALVALVSCVPMTVGAALAQDLSAKIVAVDRQSLDVGMGYDSLSGDFVTQNQCIVFARATGGAPETTVSLSEVTDSHGLSRELEIDAALEVDALLGKGEGKVGFAGKQTMTSSSQHFVAYGRTKAAETYAAPVASDGLPEALLARGGAANDALGLSAEEAGRLAGDPGRSIRLADAFVEMARTDRELFFRQCGDRFVRALHGGAEVIGLVSFETSSATEQAELREAMSASGSGWSASESARAAMESFATQGRLTLDYYETGGTDEQVPSDWDGILERIRGVKELARTPRLYQAEVMPYALLINWPGDVSPVAEPARDPLTYAFSAYRSLFVAVEAVADDPLRDRSHLLGRGVTLAALEDLSDELADLLDDLRPRLEACDEVAPDNTLACDATGLPDPYAFRQQLPFAFPTATDAGRRDTSAAFLDVTSLRQLMGAQLIEAHRTAACQIDGHPACIRRSATRGLIEGIEVLSYEGEGGIERTLDPTHRGEGCLLGLNLEPGAANWEVYSRTDCDLSRNVPFPFVTDEEGRWRIGRQACALETEPEDGVNLFFRRCTDDVMRDAVRVRLVDGTPAGAEGLPRRALALTGDGRCLVRQSNDSGVPLIIAACDATDPSHRWSLR